MRRKTTLAIAVVTPVMAIGGWLLFRPDLLFVNKTVNEKLPQQVNNLVDVLAKGDFQSYAHETKGQAEIANISGKNYLQFSGFSTSNGPDVHVYLVKGSDGSGAGVTKNGYLDLGTIKGNIGTQNYEIPATASTAD